MAYAVIEDWIIHLPTNNVDRAVLFGRLDGEGTVAIDFTRTPDEPVQGALIRSFFGETYELGRPGGNVFATAREVHLEAELKHLNARVDSIGRLATSIAGFQEHIMIWKNSYDRAALATIGVATVACAYVACNVCRRAT